jgi:hypothetical protein
MGKCSSCPHFLHMVLSKRPVVCRCHLNVQCSRSVDCLTEGFSMKTLDCFILGLAAPVFEAPLLQLLNLEPTNHMERMKLLPWD